MANKKIHITTEVELLRAMRITGYSFPMNAFEQKISLKLKKDIDIKALANTIDPTQIWNAEDPKEYKITIIKTLTIESTLSEHWGIAAKGSSNISKEIMDKIIKNQEKG